MIDFIKKRANVIAALLIAIMSILTIASAWNESPIIDELAHIPAGYSYVKYQDYRLNPEHPPLPKILAGAALLPLNPNFPTGEKAWTIDVNGQWDTGWRFFYSSGNDAETLIRAARMPMVILLIVLGIFMYSWTKKEYGPLAGLIALALFSFSPNFIAHGRYVTTDIAAVLGIVIGLYYFTKFLRVSSIKNALIAGVALGVAMVLKFSVFILYPFLVLCLILFVILNKKTTFSFLFKSKKFWGRVASSVFGFLFLGIMSMCVVWAMYALVSLGTPEDIGAKTIREIMLGQVMGEGFMSNAVLYGKDLLLWMNSVTFFRPLAHFFLGIFMVIFRVGGGNNAFLVGEVTRQSWWYFYPIAFLIKTPIPTLLLLASAIGFSWLPVQKIVKEKKDLSVVVNRHLGLIVLGFFAIVFFLIAVMGNLNLGIRHIAPIYPAIYMFIAAMLAKLFRQKNNKAGTIMRGIVGIMVIWLIAEAARIYPYYLAYFNNSIGSPDNAYKYLVDSNLDWGQDLKRLNSYLEKNKIDTIHINYFGGGNLEYYLKGKAMPFNPDTDSVEPGWYAFSATPFQTQYNGIETAPELLKQLRQTSPDAQIGHSILLYYIEK